MGFLRHIDLTEIVTGGNLLYILEDIPSKLIDTKMTTKSFFVEVNLRGKKGLQAVFIIPKPLSYQVI